MSKEKEKDRVVELKNKKFAFISIVLVVLFSLGYFGFQAFEEATYTYHSVEDLLSNEDNEQNLNILKVFDTDKQDWRSFRVENVILIKT